MPGFCEVRCYGDTLITLTIGLSITMLEWPAEHCIADATSIFHRRALRRHRIAAYAPLSYRFGATDGISMIKTLFMTVSALTLVAAGSVHAADPIGTWLVQDRTAKVRVVACGQNLCGTVVWLSEPNDKATGRPQTDKLNSDPQLRSRAMLGVPVLLAMQRSEENKWAGQIYNPDDGNTYRGTIEVQSATQLKVRACVAVFCQSEIWTRID